MTVEQALEEVKADPSAAPALKELVGSEGLRAFLSSDPVPMNRLAEDLSVVPAARDAGGLYRNEPWFRRAWSSADVCTPSPNEVRMIAIELTLEQAMLLGRQLDTDIEALKGSAHALRARLLQDMRDQIEREIRARGRAHVRGSAASASGPEAKPADERSSPQLAAPTS